MVRGLDVARRVAEHPDVLSVDATSRVRVAALDRDGHERLAYVRVGAVAAEREAVPEVAVKELAACAGLEVAGLQAEVRASGFEREGGGWFATKECGEKLPYVGGKLPYVGGGDGTYVDGSVNVNVGGGNGGP